MNPIVLLYDGDCAFCMRWVRKWQRLTGTQVLYFPYQKMLSQFPQIKQSDCEKSVQLIFPDGTVLSGAHAVFKLLDLSGEHLWLLWSYQNVPFFELISETIYSLIARNRAFFSKIF